MKIFFLALISLLFFCQMVLAQNKSEKGFAIYLLPEKITPDDVSKLDLKKLKPKGTPIVAENEIQYYQKDTHQFRIDYTASKRLKQLQNRGCCNPFAVFVGDEAIYVGAFWKNSSSQSFDGIIINTEEVLGNPPYNSNTDYPVLTLELGFLSPEYFKSADLRSDSRIFKALQAAGKLYEEVELFVTCKTIVGTGKRRASFIFTLPVVAVTKGEFAEKEITIELFDGKLLDEFDAESKMFIGENNNFNNKQEVILKISKQVGKEKPDWFLIEYKKK